MIAFNYLSILIPIDAPDHSKMSCDEGDEEVEGEEDVEEVTLVRSSHEHL